MVPKDHILPPTQSWGLLFRQGTSCNCSTLLPLISAPHTLQQRHMKSLARHPLPKMRRLVPVPPHAIQVSLQSWATKNCELPPFFTLMTPSLHVEEQQGHINVILMPPSRNHLRGSASHIHAADSNGLAETNFTMQTTVRFHQVFSEPKAFSLPILCNSPVYPEDYRSLSSKASSLS
jgi:hypothetical protein